MTLRGCVARVLLAAAFAGGWALACTRERAPQTPRPARDVRAAQEPAPPPGDGLPPGAAIASVDKPRYTVRGLVRALPPDARPGSERPITILHQAIPNFRNRDGEEVGMMAMAMPFRVGTEVSLDGLSAGDPIEFSFEVDWDASIPTKVVSLTRLAPGTAIEFGP